ncbi:tail completion protein gp17 [Shimia sagamensis]|uniref:DUF3168 domain-containing protein n=1 Tax=Shimia sagamensis TaxID=1566352 RepID=A0ABY1PDM0_9RHOB|nr:DUF3168 domain-containing protein [Shimia sagamensis]SMP32176.1 Protein of unknown function [Shimia sagamensis]
MQAHLKTLLDGVLSCPIKWGFFRDGEALPRVTLTQMGGKRDHTLNTKGLMRSTVQIDCWAEGYDEAKLTAVAVRGVLEGYRGAPIVLARLTAERDHDVADASQAARVSVTFAVTHRG